MKKSKNITVRVTPELYRQTRHLAASYDTTVTKLVEFLLERMPSALATTHYLERRRQVAESQISSSSRNLPDIPLPPVSPKAENPCCTAVRAPSSYVSEASSPQPGACTPAVPLYIAPNQHNQNGLHANRKTCTAVVQRLFRSLSNWPTKRKERA
jgi:hypothetical protein